MDIFENFVVSKVNSLEDYLKNDFESLATYAATKNCDAAIATSREIAEAQTYLKVYKELLSIYKNTR